MLLRAALCTILLVVAASQPVTAVKNVLFLVSDDLRPELNVAYGKQFVLSPNLDKLAGQSVVFDRAYTNFAICSASRNSFMTGRMPDTVQGTTQHPPHSSITTSHDRLLPPSRSVELHQQLPSVAVVEQRHEFDSATVL